MHPPLVDFFMEKPCEICKTVTICDSDHRICYDCFVELDLKGEESMYSMKPISEEEE